jgi:predicted ATPase
MQSVQPPVRRGLPFRVVVTGGPCSGKTTLWTALGERFPGAVKVPETATALILSGLTPQALGLPRFQRLVFQRQVEAEESALRQGLFLLCDRGLADGLAYFPGLIESLPTSGEALLDRYALVLHLEVVRDPERYASLARGNPARTEDHAGALSLDQRIRQVYEPHPAYFYLTGSLEEKKAEAVRILVRSVPFRA